MGYPFGYKGYKLYDIATKKFIISRDVLFFEHKFPFHTSDLTTSPEPFPDTVLPMPIPEPTITTDTAITPETREHSPPPATKPTAITPETREHSPPPVNEPNHALVPDHDPDVLPVSPPRRSTRPHNPPPYLQDYIHQTTYPIQEQLTHSKSYRTFLFNLNNHYEPKY